MSEFLVQANEYLDVVFQYGTISVYVIIFAVCFIENIIPPVPGDSFMLAGGVLVAFSRLDAFVTIAVICFGGMASSMLLYFFGKSHGRNYFMKKNFAFCSVNDLLRAERRLHAYGAWLVVCLRFLIGVRSVLTVAIGIGRYPFWKMLTYSLISYVAFSSLLVFGAKAVVDNLQLFEQYILTYSLVLWAVIIAVAVIWLYERYIVHKHTN